LAAKTKSQQRPFRSQAETIVDRLLGDHPPELVAEIRRVLAERAPKRGGRTPVDDSRRLRRMAELLYSREATSEHEAARIVAREDPGESETATARRIRRKFAENREALLAAAKRSKELESDPAFAEPVEQWDL
jgi:hypothetical protein